MTKLLTNVPTLLLLTIIFFSCGAPTTEDSVISDTVTPEQLNNEPVLDIVEEPLMEKDAITTPVEATPEHTNEENTPKPEILDASPAAKPAAAPVKLKKPAADGTKTESPAVSLNPPSTSTSTPPASETSTPAPATPPSIEQPVDAPKRPTPPNHDDWDALLKQYVNQAGNVNYAAFKKDEAKLDAYLAELAGNAPNSDWTRREGMAYWINAYNAATIKLILNNWPVKSIIDLHGGKPWDVKWIDLGGKTYSLNGIEHDILRPRYKDPGIHFAVNCAAVSCPPIPNKAFTPSNLTGLMGARARAFIRNPAYNTIGETVAVSKIFDWYGEDFGDLREYLNKYTTTPIPEDTKIGFKEYDWALNKQ